MWEHFKIYLNILRCEMNKHRWRSVPTLWTPEQTQEMTIPFVVFWNKVKVPNGNHTIDSFNSYSKYVLNKMLKSHTKQTKPFYHNSQVSQTYVISNHWTASTLYALLYQMSFFTSTCIDFCILYCVLYFVLYVNNSSLFYCIKNSK